MKLGDFNFELPKDRIATHPKDPRDSAKLMVIDRKNDDATHSHFFDLARHLKEGDFLVFNQSKVIPARLFGTAGNKKIEILLLKGGFNVWETMARPGKTLQNDSEIVFTDKLRAKVTDIKEGVYKLEFNLKDSYFWEEIEKIGEMPLPPYILKERHERHDEGVDRQDYQTVYAKEEGSVAAPTAGLHFTKELMDKIKNKRCDVGFVDLHVGLGTFEPIRTENIEDHKIHSEYFELTEDLANKLNKAKKDGRRIIAVGTTTVRVLESCQKEGVLEPKKGETNIYIYPGYKFKVIDGLITNFHLPKSSLLLLVSAFWSREKVLAAYEEAIKNDYRFYSYGDGMLII